MIHSFIIRPSSHDDLVNLERLTQTLSNQIKKDNDLLSSKEPLNPQLLVVAEAKNELIGYIGYKSIGFDCHKTKKSKCKKNYFLDSLYISSEYRQTQLAKNLILSSLSGLERQSAKNIVVQCKSANIPYKDLGFFDISNQCTLNGQSFESLLAYCFTRSQLEGNFSF